MTDTAEQAKDKAFVKFWADQLDSYYQEYKNWENRCEKIVQRYRDDRATKANGENLGGARFSALWSNIQTLLPAIYIKPPQPVIERRYLDKDPIARFASMTLERSLEVTIEQCGFHASTRMAVMDYLLCARGVTWDRYKPTYGTPEDIGPTPADDESSSTSVAERSAIDDEEEGEPTEAPRPVTWEKVYKDYVHYRNFRHSLSPIWQEVTWVAKRDFLTRKELRTRFKKIDPQSGRPVADLIPVAPEYEQTAQERQDSSDSRPKSKNKTPKAAVWEIWDKTSRKVIFIAPEWPMCALEVTDDPLRLQEFWPCQKPLYGTTTNDTLIPIPDYVEYQDQAEELDNLTQRIKALTDAVRVNGVYDASFPALKRILQEGADNRMIGIASYAEFASKGGLESALDFVPIKDVVEALIKLYEARDRVKADMAEITGLSDIVRGQAQGATKTATEQRIKGQFASLRLDDRKAEIARFCRDSLAISAEIIAEQFSENILAEMTGMIPFIMDELKAGAPQQQSPMMGHNGGPPLEASPAQSPTADIGAPGGAVPPGQPAGVQPDPQMIAAGIFAECVKLLKNDKMRTFRIDIETDSTIEIDRQQAKEAVVELFTAVGGFLEKALPIGQVMPQLTPALGQSLLFAFRRFGVGRDVEGAWEQAIDKLTQMAKNPPPPKPTPEEIKAQAEMQKQQMENQRAQEEAQREREQAQIDMQMFQQKHAMEMEKMKMQLQVEQEKLRMKQEEMALDMQMAERKAQVEAQSLDNKARLDERTAELQAESIDHKHEVGMEMMDAKAKQAKQKPKAQA